MNHGATVRRYQQSDGYVTHYRQWGLPAGEDAIVMLHGGVSHSGWQVPLAEAFMSKSEIAFIAHDRRGSGMNDDRGHLPDAGRAVDDVIELLRFLKDSFKRVHLAGWCFGAQVATAVVAQLPAQKHVSSLSLLTPGYFFNDRYSDVLKWSVEAALAAKEEFGLTPDPTCAYIRVPLQPSDFTSVESWRHFIVADKLRLTRVTEGTVVAWDEIARRAEEGFARIADLPVLAVFAARDRLVDNERARAFLFATRDVIVRELDADHALHFEHADALAALMVSFVERGRVL